MAFGSRQCEFCAKMFLVPLLTPYGAFYALGFSCVVAAEAFALYRFWLKGLLVKRLPARITAPSHKKSKAFIRDINHRHETMPKESAEWLCILLAKFYADFFDTKAFNWYFYTQYVRSIFNFRRTPFGCLIPVIASVNFYTQKKADIEKFYTGDNFLRFKNFCVPYQSTDHSALTITCDMAYDGNCQGVAVVETVFGVKFTLSGVLRHFVGTLMFQYDDLFYGYSLIKAPEMDMSIVVFVNNWEIPWFTRFANWLMNKVWLHKNVLPNTRSRWTKNKPAMAPYPWEVAHLPDLIYAWPPPPPSPSSSDSGAVAAEMPSDCE